MTELNDDQVSEIQWASSDEGKAAHKAAWERAQALCVHTGRAEIGAIVWAAHVAAENARQEN